MPLLKQGRRTGAVRALLALGVAWFLFGPLRAGWMRGETDFPNYYTAAVLVHHGQHLRDFYDWTWFQRQMNYAGVERQLGAYTQTPLTMLPMVPIAGFAPQNAKRIWLGLNVAMLVAAIWLLSRVTQFRKEQTALLALAGYSSLRTNFLLGQYYVFLLFLLVLVYWLLVRGKQAGSGSLAAAAFALKLYGGPLLLYFVATRKWKAAAAFVAAAIAAAVLVVTIFGWGDACYYASQVLPRSLEGASIDPYNPANATLATLLHRLFVFEPELNPLPVSHQPALFFFLQPFVSIAVLVFTTAAVAINRTTDEPREFALFTLAMLLVSTNLSSYSFVLLLLPTVLCLEHAGALERIYLIASYVLLNLPLPAAWLFPKLWLLLALWMVSGRRYWPRLSPSVAAAMAAAIAIFCLWNAERRLRSYREEPAQHFERIAMQRGGLFSASPAVSRAGLFFQSIGRDRYVLRWLHENRIEELAFDGHAFHPIAPDPAGPVYFELVAHRASTLMAFDPLTRTAKAAPAPPRSMDAAISPDGTWVAFTSNISGPAQVLLRRVDTGRVFALTGGDCNSFGPAWELDSRAVIFASDCGRGMGLPALYRAITPPN